MHATLLSGSWDEDNGTLSTQDPAERFRMQLESSGTRPPLGSVAAALERRLLQNNIQEMVTAIQLAHSRLNTLAPISYLPPEILSSIFSLLLEAFVGDASAPLHEADQGPSRGRIQMRWVVVTHVCRQWRYVALDTPSLWSHLPLDIDSHWIEAVVERAKPVPLQLTLTTMQKVIKTSFRILQQVHDIKSIMVLAKLHQMEELLSNLTRPVQALETAILCGVYEEERSLPLIVSTPDNLFAGETPSLRSLSFDGCTIPWASPVFQNLHYLTIALPFEWFQTVTFVKKRTVRARREDLVPSMEQLLDILDRMPMLRSLALRRCLPLHQIFNCDIPPARMISLRNLSILELAGQVSDCAAVLHRLKLPSDVDMRIIGDSRFDSRDEILQAECTPLLRTVKQHMFGDTSQVISPVVDSVEVVLGGTVSVRMYRCGSPRVKIDIALPVKDYLEIFFSEIPLLEATSLSFQEEPLPQITFLSAAAFWETFALGNANFEWVQSLTINDSLIRRVCDAMRTDAFYLTSDIPIFVRDTERVTRCTFPHLKDVTLHALRPTIPGEVEHVGKTLDEVIRFRNMLGAPLRRLIFSGIPTKPSSRKSIEELVEDLASVCPSATMVTMVP
ncbi:hypothetical protein DENSPDRAFT_209564 [Dentipellis sp. KUC8613]|nr:hypothetical protein DENSPDRAFT_209564 [Dentipellis sp. KUC8613]